jgi:hypothetical protein
VNVRQFASNYISASIQFKEMDIRREAVCIVKLGKQVVIRHAIKPSGHPFESKHKWQLAKHSANDQSDWDSNCATDDPEFVPGDYAKNGSAAHHRQESH